MKLLICSRTETVTKEGREQYPLLNHHLLTPAHIKQIKAVAKNLDIVVARGSEAANYARDVDIIAGFPATIPSVDQAPRVKWIHSFSAGVDRVLTPAVAKSQIILSNSSGIHKTPIAEHVIGFMLLFNRGFIRSLKNQERRAWGKDESLTELRGKTVLIVGLGNIGGEIARLADAFGSHVIGITKSAHKPLKWVHEMKTSAVLDKMLPKADFIVSCLPHTKETHYLFNAKKFAKMKSSAVFINIGRGGLVHEKDLAAVLKKGTIAGAALDVTEIEPLPASSPLWNAPNIVITPHQSGLSEQYMNRAIDRFCLNLAAFLKDKPLPNLVDKKRGY